MMTGFMLPYDALEEYEGLTDEQFGRLIRAGLRFARDGEETELNAPESYLYPGLKLKIARDKEKYQEKCRKNAENIRQRWNNPPPGTDTNVYDRIRTNTNDTNNNINPNPNIKSNPNPNHQSQSQEQARTQLRAEGYTESEIAWAIARAGNGQAVRDWTKYLRQSIENARKKPVKAQDYEQRDYSEEPTETPEQMLARYTAEMDGGGDE